MFLVVIFSFCVLQVVFGNTCISRKYDHDSIVCVCNETYCDTYDKVKPLNKGSYVKYVSSSAGHRLHRSDGYFSIESTSLISNELIISPQIEYQRIFGWGAHFTDTTGELLNALPVGAQRRFLHSYWSNQGSEYSLARVPMGGTDFSGRYYTYIDEYEDGTELRGFNLTEEDLTLKIPHILTAKDISEHPIRFVATPWTAPAWMKRKNNFAGGELKPEYYQAFADYYIKFLDAYRLYGIDFWAITTGNEPANGYIPKIFINMPTMVWNPITGTKWMKENLGPTIRNSKYHKNIKILIHDDQRSLFPSLQMYCMDKEAMKYPDGIASHWYADTYTPEKMLRLANCPNREDLFLLMTEATAGLFQIIPVALGSWSRAESYVDSIITYMLYHYSGWMDWNQTLDTKGGPNLTGYNVDSTIIVNATAGEFYKQPTFYSMAHFSKFVPPGSVRIASQYNRNVFDIFSKIRNVAFKRPDGGIVIVVHNKENSYVQIIIKDAERGQIEITLEPKSVTTVLYW